MSFFVVPRVHTVSFKLDFNWGSHQNQNLGFFPTKGGGSELFSDSESDDVDMEDGPPVASARRKGKERQGDGIAGGGAEARRGSTPA